MAFSLRPLFVASTTLALLTSCGGQDTADALIGPEGGVVAHDDGVTLTVPPGALLVTRQIIIRPSDEKLSRGDFEQVGDAYLIEPRDLEFRVPATLTFDTSIKEKPTVLLKPGENRVIAYSASDDKPTAYIGTLGVVAAATGGDAIATVDAPKLARTPDATDLKSPAIDKAELKVTPKGASSLDIGFTAFDLSGESKALLNGDGTQYCGFQLGAVLGASKIGGCALNVSSGVLALSAPQATIEVQPFLIGKLDRPVVVEVQVGTGDLVFSAGYFAFDTSECYLVSCAGKGDCMEAGSKAMCTCDEGFATLNDPLICECVPQCKGKQCGGDSCGGQCGGCNQDTHTCNDETQQCDPLPPPESTGDPETTTTGMPNTTGEPDTTTTGEPGTTSGTTDVSSSSSSSGGSSSSSTT